MLLRYTKTKSGNTTTKPVYMTEQMLAWMLDMRRFATMAGFRAAAKAMRNQGFPMHYARWVLLADDPQTLIRLAAARHTQAMDAALFLAHIRKNFEPEPLVSADTA